VQWNEGTHLQLRWLLHDANDNSCSYNHSCSYYNPLPHNHTMPHNYTRANDQPLHLQELLLPISFRFDPQARNRRMQGTKWMLNQALLPDGNNDASPHYYTLPDHHSLPDNYPSSTNNHPLPDYHSLPNRSSNHGCSAMLDGSYALVFQSARCCPDWR